MTVTMDLDATGVPLRVGVAATDRALAGGPLTVTWELHTQDGSTAYCALGADRVRSRTARMSFTAALENQAVGFTDPLADRIDLGGPSAAHSLPLTFPVLVNQFLTVEAAREVLPPGGIGTLLLSCHWQPTIARGRDKAFDPDSRVELDLELRVPLRRDDAALHDLVRQLARQVLSAGHPDEDALISLVALRHPATSTILSQIGADAERLAWALAAVDRA